MVYTLAHLQEAMKMFHRSDKPYTRYEGTPKQICRYIVSRCWNGVYFQVSTGHFTAFYCRDFGMCAQSLCNLGYTREVRATLSWALDIFSHNKKITTTITKRAQAIDCFAFACDSLPFLLHALQVSGDKKLITKNKSFIEKQAVIYFEKVFDKNTHLVKEKGAFSSIKDHYVRKSSCYDNCMVGWLITTMQQLGYELPQAAKTKTEHSKAIDMRKQILTRFWTGTYFKDDLYSDVASSDAQFFPFYTKIFDAKKRDKKIWALANKKIDEQQLAYPFPIKYTKVRDKKKELFIPSLLVPNYEGTTLWIHLGLCYLTVLAQTDKRATAKHLDTYTKLVAKHKNFFELFNEDGTPYKSKYYQSDESMSWASIYLDLSQQIHQPKKEQRIP